MRAPHEGEPDDDDLDALSWAGDRDAQPAPTAHATATPAAVADAPRTSSLALVGFGVLAGVYLIYTVGWVNAVLGGLQPVGDLLSTIMVQLGQFLAIASPALWFTTAILLTRDCKPLVRALWIVAGLLVVAPWPLVLGW